MICWVNCTDMMILSTSLCSYEVCVDPEHGYGGRYGNLADWKVGRAIRC